MKSLLRIIAIGIMLSMLLSNAAFASTLDWEIARPTEAKVLVNGKQIEFEAYNIKGNNYFKLRDLAYVLNGSDKQFGVEYNSALKTIQLSSGKKYAAVGGEMSNSNLGLERELMSANINKCPIYKDDQLISLDAYNINGFNYFKLRDIGKLFDFGVTWDPESKTINIDTSANYIETEED